MHSYKLFDDCQQNNMRTRAHSDSSRKRVMSAKRYEQHVRSTKRYKQRVVRVNL